VRAEEGQLRWIPRDWGSSSPLEFFGEAGDILIRLEPSSAAETYLFSPDLRWPGRLAYRHEYVLKGLHVL